MNISRNILTIGLMGITGIIAGCGNTTTPISQTNDYVVKVGVIAPLSGPGSTYGEDAVNTYEIARKQLKEQYPHVTLNLIYEDGKCGAKDSVSAVQKLIAVDKVDVILGGICSGETIAAGKIAQQNKVLMLSPTSSSPVISGLGEYVFRFWNDVEAVASLRHYIEEQAIQKVGIIYENTEYSEGLQNEFATKFAGEAILIEKFQSEDKSYDIIAKKLRTMEKNVDVVLIVTQSEAPLAGLIKAFDSEGLTQALRGRIYAPYLATSSAFLDEVGMELAEGMLEVQIPGRDSLGTKAKNFITTFEKEHEVQSVDFALTLTREGIELIAQAASKGHTDTESMRTYFNQITKENPQNGFFGSYYFDHNGDAQGLTYIVQQIQSGEVVVLGE